MSTRYLRVFLAAAVFVGAACDDDSAPISAMVDAAPAPVPDADTTADMGTNTPDMAAAEDAAPSPVEDAAPAPEDAAPDPDMAPQPDAAPDMDVIPDPILEPSEACGPEGECGLNQGCIDGGCWYDLTPNFYRIEEIVVSEPSISGGLLQGFLAIALMDGRLNMLVEPGGYGEDLGSYRWYIGTGSQSGGQYYYFHQYPIQNFDGFWREGEVDTSAPGDVYNGPYWTMEGNTPFVLNVPTGRVEIEGRVTTCFVEIALEVQLNILPPVDADSDDVTVWVSGFLRESEAEQVNFLLNGMPTDLVGTILDPDDLTVDTDGDEIPDAFPFDFVAFAGPVAFDEADAPLPDGSNRDPDPDYMNPAECEASPDDEG